METAQSPARRVRPRPVFRTVQVRRSTRITPNVVRCTLAGAELDGFAIAGPAGHIKMYFPAPGQSHPVLPEWGPNGPVRREGQERPIVRVYTPRRWDAAVGELEVDIVLHHDGGGPGVSWAQHAKPGDAVVITGPAGPYRFDPEAEHYVLAGDHAGLPAVCTILEALPPTARAEVYVEVPDPAEEQKLESAATVQVHWLPGGPDLEVGRSLEAGLRTAELSEDLRVFVACEASAMRSIRRFLLQDRGLGRGAVYTHGYWKQGVANHPDHDLGEDA